MMQKHNWQAPNNDFALPGADVAAAFLATPRALVRLKSGQMAAPIHQCPLFAETTPVDVVVLSTSRCKWRRRWFGGPTPSSSKRATNAPW
jgi:hypothetical protein